MGIRSRRRCGEDLRCSLQWKSSGWRDSNLYWITEIDQLNESTPALIDLFLVLHAFDASARTPRKPTEIAQKARSEGEWPSGEKSSAIEPCFPPGGDVARRSRAKEPREQLKEQAAGFHLSVSHHNPSSLAASSGKRLHLTCCDLCDLWSVICDLWLERFPFFPTLSHSVPLCPILWHSSPMTDCPRSG